METRQDSDQEQETISDDVMDTMGMPQGSGEEALETPDEAGDQDDLPKGVKDRLGRQEKRHQRELRQMRAQMESMQANMSQQQPRESENQFAYGNESQGSDADEQIRKAVDYAMQHKERQAQQVEDGKRQQHVNKQYKSLHDHLDKTAEKYDDFDDVVRGEDVMFTPSMRDAALLLPKTGPGSAGEVLYKLGKNGNELDRIAKLHPLDQASELVRLSHALVSGQGEQKGNAVRTMGNIKSNPVSNSSAVTDKTSVSELRKRMKANWK